MDGSGSKIRETCQVKTILIDFNISYKDDIKKIWQKKISYHWNVIEKIRNKKILSRKPFCGGAGLIGVFKDLSPPNSPPPPGPGLMGEGTTGVTPVLSSHCKNLLQLVKIVIL